MHSTVPAEGYAGDGRATESPRDQPAPGFQTGERNQARAHGADLAQQLQTALDDVAASRATLRCMIRTKNGPSPTQE